MIYALMGLLGFGLVDFFIFFLSKEAGYLKGVFWNTFFMFLYFLGLLFVFGKQFELLNLHAVEIVTTGIAGIVTSVGGLFYYKGTQKGNLSVLSPISSSYSVLVIIFSVIFLSETLLPIQEIAILFVIIGTILISTNLKSIKNLKIAATDKAAPYGFLSMFCWGISFILIGSLTLKIGWLITNLLTAFSSLIFLIIFAFGKKEKSLFVPKKSTYALAMLLGIFSTMGYVGYSLGVNSTYASIVAPVVAAAPLVTVFLALLFLKEKLVTEQKIGVFLLVLGLIALAV